MSELAATPIPADFDQLYTEQFDYVWNTLRRLGVREAHLEDVAHEVFVTAWRKWSEFDRNRALKPWLFGIAYRMASDDRNRAWLRREISEEADVEDESQSPEAHVDAKQARALVQRGLEGIEINRRAVFVMHEIDGLPIPEIAEALSLPLNTAYSQLRLARRDFSAKIKQLQGDPP